MNPLLKTALVALVVVFVYDRFLKSTIDGMFTPKTDA